jgi:hypothetical protein
MALFPEEMKKSNSELTLESIASRLTYFEEQIHLIHWQTPSHAEHTALNLYDYVHDFKDDVIEKLMGYMGRKIKSYKVQPTTEITDSTAVVTELINFAYELYEWAGSNRYCDVENMAQALSGEAAKVKYLLTQS